MEQPATPPARAIWTPSRQRIFLAALLETGSVARAALAAGMSRSSAHGLRKRLAGTPFDRAWDHALTLHARRLADPFADTLAPEATAAPRPAPVASASPR
ncbi:LysR family transcriptional regulator [Sphingomonas sp. MG17]|uniref:LysR family transcriptional regulator n=1 Tax=Sphingomonas tagetis TaxID=2949092 RepID=A0A9X2KN12_9SPHN|nr:LysR family transcriptional regulator [Sphingomonas tagetis]MCP3732355.1 LysR family transcriptional regulator [Sphingomonas tagetis]